MIRSTRHLSRNPFIRRDSVSLFSKQSIACLSSSTSTSLKQELRRVQQDDHVDPDNDGASSSSLQGSVAARHPNFVPFFQEVDNLSNNGKDSVASLFRSLGEVPPPREGETTRAPPASAASPSIFDAFPLPEAPLERERSKDAYDEEAFRQYNDMMNDIFNDNRYRRMHTKKPFTDEFLAPIMAWLQAPEPLVKYDLPLLRESVESGLNEQPKQEEFRKELDVQREVFLEQVPLTKKQYDQACVALVLVGNQCARWARSLPLDVAWEKIKEAGVCLDKSTLNNYLYSCTMYVGRQSSFLSSPGDSVLDMFDSSTTASASETSTTPEAAEDEYVVNLPEEVATCHDLLYEPTEDSVTIRIKALVSKGDASGAEAVLDRFSRDEARQRTYLPILRCYLEQGDISSGLRLFKQMRDSQLCILESETYIQLLSSMAERGYFRFDSEPIEGATELGYSVPCGPKLFDELACEMAQDVLEITSASARRLYGAFESALREQDSESKFVEMHPLAPLPIANEPATGDELIVSRVAVADETGVCPRSGAKLRLIQLDRAEREQTRQSLLKLAETAYLEWSEKFEHKWRGDESALEALEHFADWLDTREGDPFTAFVDGPNVGYHMQNFDQGKFNFYQIEFMVNALESMGENPLVIVPQKYCRNNFMMRGNFRQQLDKTEMAIIERLSKEGKLYRVPPGFLDDFYWMLASISDQTVSRGDRNMDVEPDDGSGRWPGTRPMLVSNDQMRDHKLELLEPRLFRRWYSCHIVNYNFTAFVEDECVDREISFSTADFFSREIQGNPTRDPNGEYCGTAWHFPVSDWEAHERLCVRLPDRNRS